MRRVGAIAAAVILAAAISNSRVDCAQAGDLAISRPEKQFLFFAGTDVWRHGFSLHGGVVWFANGLDRDGFVFKLFAGGGTYRFHSGPLGDAEVIGDYVVGFALPGWRFKHDRLIVTVFAGVDAQNHRLRPDDPTSKLRGTLIGGRGAIEIWYEPNSSTMLEAHASLSPSAQAIPRALPMAGAFSKNFTPGRRCRDLPSTIITGSFAPVST